MVVVAKKERQDISFNHYTVNSRQEILCEPRATYILCKEIYIYFERSRVLPTTMIYIYSYHIKYGSGGEEGETRHIFQSLYSEL